MEREKLCHDFSKYFFISVLNAEPKLARTPESVEERVIEDKGCAETQHRWNNKVKACSRPPQGWDQMVYSAPPDVCLCFFVNQIGSLQCLQIIPNVICHVAKTSPSSNCCFQSQKCHNRLVILGKTSGLSWHWYFPSTHYPSFLLPPSSDKQFQHDSAVPLVISSYLLLHLPPFLPSPMLIVFIVPRSELLWEMKLHCPCLLLSFHTQTCTQFQHWFVVSPGNKHTIAGECKQRCSPLILKDEMFWIPLWWLCGIFH